MCRSAPATAGALKLAGAALDRVLAAGPRELLERHGIGSPDDVEHTESNGCLEGADPTAVSERARERGADQLGTLGSGNHFLELQRVAAIIDPAEATALQLREGQVTMLIHSGSRGLGHQVCTDYVRRMDAALDRYAITLPDRQLACAPLFSPEGQSYHGAMAAAANFAWANRATLAHRVREAIAQVLGPPGGTRYAARSTTLHTTWPSSSATPAAICACTARGRRARSHPARRRSPPPTARSASPCSSRGAWARAASCSLAKSARWSSRSGPPATGPGRRMSRTGARRQIGGAELRRQLEARGIVVRCPSSRGLAEEAPFAYKDVERVVAVVERAGLARRVAQLFPLGVVKG